MAEDQLNRPRIGLALSGGAARGIAHVGVLRALEENEIPIDVIAGASAGALIGGAYAAGLSIKQLETMAREHGEFTVYVVEVCQGCSWNHLALSYVLGDGTPRRPPRRRRTVEDDD